MTTVIEKDIQKTELEEELWKFRVQGGRKGRNLITEISELTL